MADQIACALEFPGAAQQPARVEHGLRLALELCDSSITYRSRYLAVLQPAPALDLMLADDGNPRGLAFQLAAMRALLSEIASGDGCDAGRRCGGAAGRTAGDGPARSAKQLISRWRRCSCRRSLRALRDAVAELSDRVSRRYFTLLPTARAVGIEAPAPTNARARRDLPRAARDPLRLQAPVDLGAHLAHLRPRQLPHQKVLRAGVHAAPAVSWRREGSDHFGNEVTWLFLDVAHAAFQVIADATVDVDFPAAA